MSIFGRRKADRLQGRLIILLLGLALVSALLAACIGYKALVALGHFDQAVVEFLEAARAEKARRSPLAGPY
jgi:integral membrane sensor domain MASE1